MITHERSDDYTHEKSKQASTNYLYLNKYTYTSEQQHESHGLVHRPRQFLGQEQQ